MKKPSAPPVGKKLKKASPSGQKPPTPAKPISQHKQLAGA